MTSTLALMRTTRRNSDTPLNLASGRDGGAGDAAGRAWSTRIADQASRHARPDRFYRRARLGGDTHGWLSAGAAPWNRTLPKEHIMGVLGWIILGLVAGAIAKVLHKGHEPGGLLGTLVVGVAGALVGGFIAAAVGIGGIGSFFSLGTWLIAIAGALLLLAVYSTLAGGRQSTRASG
jgi:uncharacterized membrane protein YeaQ/YmgE (transglycosylase-associated protein family)